jgi:hypothetical protein
VDYESHATALDRNEVGALLVAAGLRPAAEHALISLLALNGLRVSEATGADIEHLGLERGHRTLVVTRKGGKVVTVSLAPRTARAIDLAVGERTAGPLFLAADGKRLDRHGAARVVRRVTRRAGITKKVGPHTLRHAFITAAPPPSTRAFRCETVRRPHRTPTRAPPCATTAPAPASTATPLTSSPPTSPEQPGNPRRWAGRRKRPGQHGRDWSQRSPAVTATIEREPPICAATGAGLSCPKTAQSWPI